MNHAFSAKVQFSDGALFKSSWYNYAYISKNENPNKSAVEGLNKEHNPKNDYILFWNNFLFFSLPIILNIMLA